MRALDNINSYEGHGRLLTVQFTCERCGCTASRPLQDCLPSDGPPMFLSDLKPPSSWRNGGFYYPLFCPGCAEKYDRFMKGEDADAQA